MSELQRIPQGKVESRDMQQELVRINDGYIYLDSDICQRYFQNISSVVIILHPVNQQALIMPVHNQSSGGLLLKQRNKNGDRVVAAMDFLRSQQIPDEADLLCSVRWDEEYHGLALTLDGIGNRTQVQ
jgi:hypothetical protein